MKVDQYTVDLIKDQLLLHTTKSIHNQPTQSNKARHLYSFTRNLSFPCKEKKRRGNKATKKQKRKRKMLHNLRLKIKERRKKKCNYKEYRSLYRCIVEKNKYCIKNVYHIDNIHPTSNQ